MSAKNDSDAKDRRNAPRVPVQIWAEETGDRYRCFHLLSNMSRSGLRVEKKIPFQAGAVVSLELALPGPGPKLKIQGRVVDNYRDADSNITGAGIMFINTSKHDQEKIDTYINLLQKT